MTWFNTAIALCLLVLKARVAWNNHIDLHDILAAKHHKDGSWILPLDNSIKTNGWIDSRSEDGMPFRERGLLQRRSGTLSIDGSVRETGWVVEGCILGPWRYTDHGRFEIHGHMSALVMSIPLISPLMSQSTLLMPTVTREVTSGQKLETQSYHDEHSERSLLGPLTSVISPRLLGWGLRGATSPLS